MRHAFIAVCGALFVSQAARALIPITTGPDIVWHGDFDGAGAVLSGNCNFGMDGYCSEEVNRTAQVQILTSPLAEGQHAAYFEVKHGDFYPPPPNNYSENRALL